MNRMAGISTSTPFFTTRLFSRWERGCAWRALPSSSCAVEELARRPAGLDFGLPLRGRPPRGTPATRGRRRVADVHVKHSDEMMGRSAVRVPVRGRRTRQAGADQHVHLCSPSGKRCGCGWCRRSRGWLNWGWTVAPSRRGWRTTGRRCILYVRGCVHSGRYIEERQTDGQTDDIDNTAGCIYIVCGDWVCIRINYKINVYLKYIMSKKYTFIFPTKWGTAFQTFYLKHYMDYFVGTGHGNVCKPYNNPIIIVETFILVLLDV
jgi:hypothetical protein